MSEEILNTTILPPTTITTTTTTTTTPRKRGRPKGSRDSAPRRSRLESPVRPSSSNTDLNDGTTQRTGKRGPGRPKGSRDSAPRRRPSPTRLALLNGTSQAFHRPSPTRSTSPGGPSANGISQANRNPSPTRSASNDGNSHAGTPATGVAKSRIHRGRPATALEPHKDLIIKLFREEGKSHLEIARHVSLAYDLDASDKTIARRLRQWNVPTRQIPPASQEVIDRLTFYYNKNMKDDQIVDALNAEGFDYNVSRLARLRKKIGLRRRSKFPMFTAHTDQLDEGTSGAGGGAEQDDGVETNAESSVPAPPLPATVAKKKKKMKNKVLQESQQASLIPKVTAFVQKYMSKYDGSHDFNHIRRVVGLAHRIYTEINLDRGESVFFDEKPALDLHVITLAALLHDVGDKKYLKPGQNAETLVLATLLEFGAREELALKVQRIVLRVSYSTEIEDPDRVTSLIEKYPELAVVQDADRLDAIGAVGIGRTFTFGGAKGAREMGETIQHFEDKLLNLEAMMKTEPGKRMAKERTERLKLFMGWWQEEQKEAEGLLKRTT